MKNNKKQIFLIKNLILSKLWLIIQILLKILIGTVKITFLKIFKDLLKSSMNLEI